LNDARVDINCSSNDGYTGLMKAAYYGHIAIIEYILASMRHIESTDITNAIDKAKSNNNNATSKADLLIRIVIMACIDPENGQKCDDEIAVKAGIQQVSVVKRHDDEIEHDIIGLDHRGHNLTGLRKKKKKNKE